MDEGLPRQVAATSRHPLAAGKIRGDLLRLVVPGPPTHCVPALSTQELHSIPEALERGCWRAQAQAPAPDRAAVGHGPNVTAAGNHGRWRGITQGSHAGRSRTHLRARQLRLHGPVQGREDRQLLIQQLRERRPGKAIHVHGPIAAQRLHAVHSRVAASVGAQQQQVTHGHARVLAFAQHNATPEDIRQAHRSAAVRRWPGSRSSPLRPRAVQG
mmetsp:Transcript_33954/g.107904  ORF Transcript_33954/g.107904 Transcript_33954/m.107904 type:complete len:214 (+) Transcript_33954:1773-2414(+)